MLQMFFLKCSVHCQLYDKVVSEGDNHFSEQRLLNIFFVHHVRAVFSEC